MSRSRRLLGSSSILTLALMLGGHGAAVAQDAPPAQEPQPGAEQQAPETERVVVTGTRIAVPGLTSTNPITSVTGESIQYSGQSTVGDRLKEFPALVGGLTPSEGAPAAQGADTGLAGLNLLNLRNLGTERTLVLVNGRRHVGATRSSVSVDVDTIPTDLIQRIDILTGGASAVYGADGVTGVVNFVLRDDFKGWVARGQYGASRYNDANTYFSSLTYGNEFGEGRGNFSVSFEYSNQDALEERDRFMFSNAGFQSFYENPADPLDDPNIPDNILFTGVGYFFSSRVGQILDLNFDAWRADTGAAWDFGICCDGAFQIGGDGGRVAEYRGWLLPEGERTSGNLNADYDITSDVRFFIEAKYVNARALAGGQPTFDDYLAVRTDNAFLPPALALTAGANPIPGFLVQAFFGGPGDLFGGTGAGADYLLLGKDYFDLGERENDVERRTVRVATGFDGALTDFIDWEVSYVYGALNETATNRNVRLEDRFIAASDAVDDGFGNIVCRTDLNPAEVLPAFFADSSTGDPGFSSVGGSVSYNANLFGSTFTPGPGSGCVPYNVFGDNPLQNAAAAAWIMTSTIDEGEVEQNVFTAYLSGTLEDWFTLPAGGVGFALGVEYRDEYSLDTPAELDRLGYTWSTRPGGLVITEGSFDVYEVFAEVSIPILRDQPFFYDLTIDGAARYSDYSSTGSSETWKAGASWAPVQDVRFRGVISKAVRAPNIGELFQGQRIAFDFINDPCDDANITNGSGTRAANCAAALGALGVGLPFFSALTATVQGALSGNPNLDVETADNYTYGVVLQPRFLPGLSVSVDYFNTEIENAIILPSAQEIVDACYDAPSLVNQFCALQSRSATAVNLGEINSFLVRYVNVGTIATSGVDFELRYRTELGDVATFMDSWGAIQLGIVGTKLETLDVTTTAGGETDDETGEAGTFLGDNAPDLIVNVDASWYWQDLTVSYAYRWQDSVLRQEKDILASEPDDLFPFVSSEMEVHDVVVRYQVIESVELYAGVNNIGDQMPDAGSFTTPVNGLGRFYYGGFKFALN